MLVVTGTGLVQEVGERVGTGGWVGGWGGGAAGWQSPPCPPLPPPPLAPPPPTYTHPTHTSLQAANRHKTSPTASAALGRALLGTLLMGCFRQEGEVTQVRAGVRVCREEGGGGGGGALGRERGCATEGQRTRAPGAVTLAHTLPISPPTH